MSQDVAIGYYRYDYVTCLGDNFNVVRFIYLVHSNVTQSNTEFYRVAGMKCRTIIVDDDWTSTQQHRQSCSLACSAVSSCRPLAALSEDPFTS
jgi:hypothetical protein